MKNIKEGSGSSKKGKGKSKVEDEEEEDEMNLDENEEIETKPEINTKNRTSSKSNKNSSSTSTSNGIPDPDFESESAKLTEATVTTIDSDLSHWGKPMQKPSAAEIKAAATAPETSDVRPVPIKGGGGKPLDENTLDNFYNLLPSRKITDFLIEHFIVYVHNSIPCLHIPTLRRHYLNVMNRKLKGNNKDLNVLSVSICRVEKDIGCI